MDEKIYVIKNTINKRYYQYIGKGCHRWVRFIAAADKFSIEGGCDMVDDLRCQHYGELGIDLEEVAEEQEQL